MRWSGRTDPPSVPFFPSLLPQIESWVFYQIFDVRERNVTDRLKFVISGSRLSQCIRHLVAVVDRMRLYPVQRTRYANIGIDCNNPCYDWVCVVKLINDLGSRLAVCIECDWSSAYRCAVSKPEQGGLNSDEFRLKHRTFGIRPYLWLSDNNVRMIDDISGTKPSRRLWTVRIDGYGTISIRCFGIEWWSSCRMREWKEVSGLFRSV
jgi:hypothetical protein